jgi:glycosyltransferase involved in cell wall biosynthesis
MAPFSVIIATRNRPSQFAQALRSVLSQTCDPLEIIVVNDGSDEEHEVQYHAIIEAAKRPVHFSSLVRRPKGHGAGYARNFAASLASAEYLCFLDDDDFWTDDDYLARIQFARARSHHAPDLIFSNQSAFFGTLRKEGPIWLEGLAARIERSANRPDECGLYRVDVQELLDSGGFCHMNAMIVRRALFDSIGGMDEDIRWEEDHDLFLRLIDRAETMLLSPAFVSQHNIPDPAKRASLTTSLDEIRRRLDQLHVFEKASLFAAHPAIRTHGRQYHGYTLKRIAEALATTGDRRAAAYYARQALAAAPTLKWAGYTVLRMLASSRGVKKRIN